MMAGQGHHDRLKLATLALVDGDGIGVLQLVQHLQGVGGPPVVVLDDHRLGRAVDHLDDPDVPVEDAGALPVAAFPDNVVVVLDLHHLVPLPEEAGAVLYLHLLDGGRVEGRLELLVQLLGAQDSFPPGDDDLDVPQGGVPIGTGEAGLAQLHHRGGGRLLPPSQEEEVAVPPVQHRQLPPDDGVGIGDDQALGRLAEHLVQVDGGHNAAGDQIPQQVSRPHRGQLVRVAHQNDLAGHLHRPQQGVHQEGVHHGHLVHNDSVTGEQVLLVPLKGKQDALGVHLQQPVDGFGLPAGYLGHPLGGAAGGGGQGNSQTLLLQ